MRAADFKLGDYLIAAKVTLMRRTTTEAPARIVRNLHHEQNVLRLLRVLGASHHDAAPDGA